jgi:hypothetical protein
MGVLVHGTLCLVCCDVMQGPMLSSNGCSSADIPRQVIMNDLPALPDMDIFITHVYDVAKVYVIITTCPLALYWLHSLPDNTSTPV